MKEEAIRLRFGNTQSEIEIHAPTPEEAAVLIAVHEANGWRLIQATPEDGDLPAAIAKLIENGASGSNR